MKKVLLIISVLTLLCSFWLLTKPSMSEIGIAYAQPAEPGQDLTVTWFGVTTLLIDDGVTQILIDGYFSRPSLLDIALERRIEPDLVAIEVAGVRSVTEDRSIGSGVKPFLLCLVLHQLGALLSAIRLGPKVPDSNALMNVAEQSGEP